jgi:hypothetical protein
MEISCAQIRRIKLGCIEVQRCGVRSTARHSLYHPTAGKKHTIEFPAFHIICLILDRLPLRLGQDCQPHAKDRTGVPA